MGSSWRDFALNDGNKSSRHDSNQVWFRLDDDHQGKADDLVLYSPSL